MVNLKKLIFGQPINPMHPSTRKHLALITLLAWIGLGADALSSSCYGPEEAYLAVGANSQLALYVAIFTVFTIFIISAGYSQIIELFPSGGGGYKVATKLLHPYAGLVSGSALIVDYVLTITVSIASGVDAFFSFLPAHFLSYKLAVEGIAIIILLVLNMRGIKETVRILLPIFLGFIVIHTILIVYGIVAHSKGLTTVIPATLNQTRDLAQSIGWLSVIGLVLHAYSLGSGTYTGLEAVSNNTQRLAEPRVQTGKRTMFLMAVSLSFMAGGIILLYLLWDVKPVTGQTLNAVVFHSILGDGWLGQVMLAITLWLEAGLLFVAANTGFVDGPNVLANLAVDGWMPNRFRHYSSRMVTQNGLMFLGITALIILMWTEGKVSLLVVLYSINVFITFTLSLLGISAYWYKQRASAGWRWHFALSAFACLLTASILCITIYYKFASGGWITLLITFSIIMLCLLIKRHYQYVAKKLETLDKTMVTLSDDAISPLAINPKLPTAIVFVSRRSVGMHTMLSIMRLFPNQFKNFVFLIVGTVDAESFRAEEELAAMQMEVNSMLDYFVKFCYQNGLPAEGFASFGTDTVSELKTLIDKVNAKYPNAIFFANQLITTQDNMLISFLHNQTPFILQHYLHLLGKELMIIPMRI